MRVLVLGGAGFLGRHVVQALGARGHAVVVGSRRARGTGRDPKRGAWVEARLERRPAPGDWSPLLAGVDAVVNCVGILRERGRETYERVHHGGPGALARACAAKGLRFVHVSALGLDPAARSGFIRSKANGEAAIRASGADYTIVRPSLLDGEGGFGARWLRAAAQWPLCAVPADACGNIAALAVTDAGQAIARLVERDGDGLREADLGGPDARTLDGHLAALRATGRRPPRVVRVPALLARLASHACDLLHFSPYSFGHLELLRHDNVPRVNRLPQLLGGPPQRIVRWTASRPPAQQRVREIPPAFGRAQSAMVEVDRAGQCRERPRAQRRIEHRVGHALVEKPAQRALGREARVGSTEHVQGRGGALESVVGNRVRGGEARLERRVDAAGGKRRHESRRVADEHDTAGGERRDRPAHGNEPAAPADPARAAEIEMRAQLAHERIEVGLRGPAAREADLHAAAVPRHHPADVAVRELPVEIAVQPVRVHARNAFVLGFDAQQELGVAAERKLRGDGGMRAIGAHDVAHTRSPPSMSTNPSSVARTPRHGRSYRRCAPARAASRANQRMSAGVSVARK
jgi:uncharacterized protein YbjT (DUF2867 family)